MVLTYLHFRILNFPLNYWVTHAFAVPEKLQGNRPSASMNTEGSSCSDHSCGVLQPSLWILSLVPLNWENLQGTREPMENPYIYIQYININISIYCIHIIYIYIYVFYMFHGKHNRNKKNMGFLHSCFLKPTHWWSTIVSGWWFQPLWKILVSWCDYSQYLEK